MITRQTLSQGVRYLLRSRTSKVYHCCTQKTASQWFVRFFGDSLFWRSTRLCLHDPHRNFMGDQQSVESLFSLPVGVVVSPIYASVDAFRARDWDSTERVFFVKRDPRDIIVSLYFSHRYSHKETPGVVQRRRMLEGLSEAEGMHKILQLRLPQVSDIVAQWSAAQLETHGAIRCFKFEELFGAAQRETFRALLDHCALDVSDQALDQLLYRHSFERITGRDRGSEDVQSHFRKGVAGGWRDYFTREDCLQADAAILQKLEGAGYADW